MKHNPKASNIIESLDADELMLYEVRKHPFGLIMAYFQVAAGFLAGVVLMVFLAPVVSPNSDPATRRSVLSVLIALVAIVLWLVLLLFTNIYRQSRLLITDKNLTQIIQNGLFSRKVSELSMASVEDVTSNQHGIFATIFGYGTLTVETAGEQANFIFKLCPKPNFYGKVILDARQKYLECHDDHGRKIS